MAKGKTKKEKNVEKELIPFKVSFITTCDRLRELTKLTRVITNHAVLEFNKEGLEVKTVDEKVTHSGHILISSDGMDDYSCKPKEVKFGMDFEILSKFLESVKPKSEVHCSFDGEKMKAFLKADNLNKQIELIDNFHTWKEWRQQDINPDYPNTFKEISTQDLKIAMKGAVIEIPFIDKSNNKQLTKHDKASKTFVKSKFPVGQVNKIVRSMKDKVTVSLGDNMPVEFSWYPEENMGAVFMVAPRVTTD